MSRWPRVFSTIFSARGCSRSRSPATISSIPSNASGGNGVALLPIPENYYDDLEARLDLAASLIDGLRAGDILYDRDGDAEFFHVYTRTLPGGFFFEIVERRLYRGYGVVNAPIRLAAQARLARNRTIIG